MLARPYLQKQNEFALFHCGLLPHARSVYSGLSECGATMPNRSRPVVQRYAASASPFSWVEYITGSGGKKSIFDPADPFLFPLPDFSATCRAHPTMKNPFSSKKADVISHWYALVPDFSASTQDFYSQVEQELKSRQVPDLEISRVEFSEGGLLSTNREYLRMTRERLVFDVCAAPFGTSFFYSMRFAELPSEVKLWQILLVLFILFGSFLTTLRILGFFFGLLFFILAIGAAIYVARNAVALNLQYLDAELIKMPVIGPIYERFFRRETYYRIDTRHGL